MPNLSIKDVPEDLAQQLRERAARNHRSLQGELMAILTAALAIRGTPGDPPPAPHHPSDPGVSYLRGTLTPEEVFADVRRRWPAPIDTGPLAVDILRRERDSR